VLDLAGVLVNDFSHLIIIDTEKYQSQINQFVILNYQPLDQIRRRTMPESLTLPLACLQPLSQFNFQDAIFVFTGVVFFYCQVMSRTTHKNSPEENHVRIEDLYSPGKAKP
jgi:hypothetical protein